MAKNKLRKKYQRAFNKIIHNLNKNIVEDNLWKGRFIFLQKDADFWRFYDNSGGELILIIRGYDKKTGFYKDYRLEYAPWLKNHGWKIWEIANDFIVCGSGAWEENPRPGLATAADYTKVKVNVEQLMRNNYNFYINYKSFKEGVE